jgi:sugar (pentulose or hexulose) kinase
MTKRVLAIDFGATSGRAMLCSFDGSKIDIRELHRFDNSPVEVGGVLYWDVLRLYHELKTGIVKAKLAGGFDCIGIDTWGVDFGLIDKNGKLLSNPVHYRDRRTEKMQEEVFKLVSREEIYNATGIQFLDFNTIYQLMYLKNHCPDEYERADKFIMIPDLFAYFLTGAQVCERTIASTGQLVDPRTGDWAWGLIDKLGLKRSLFPAIVDSGSVYGNLSEAVCAELQVESVPVIAVCCHDTASAVVSVPSEEDNFEYISCGTWSLLGTELKKPLFDCPDYTNEIGYDRTVRYLQNIMGLWIINESKRTWDKQGKSLGYGEIAALAEKEEGGKFIFNVNDDEFMYPGDMPEKVRNWFISRGKPAPEGIGPIARAIYDSIADCYREATDLLVKLTGKKSAIHMIGGGINATLLCQLTANSTRLPVYAGPSEATVMGNAAVQLIAIGAIKNLKEARKIIKRSVSLKEYLPS